MTDNIDTSAEVIEYISAERDALRIRAEQAERREAALLASNSVERGYLTQNASLRDDLKRMRELEAAANNEVDRLRSENDAMRADVERLRAECFDQGWNAAIDVCSEKRAGAPRILSGFGTGALLGEQQWGYDKGWRESAASMRKAISALKRKANGESHE